jgi:hypothetical protein
MERRVSVPLFFGVLLAGLAVAAGATGCASSSGGTVDGAASSDDGETAAALCGDGCRVRVENRLSGTRIEVTASRLQGVDRLGVVEASSSGTFEVTGEDFEGGQVELWMWDARTGERLGLYRLRSFPGGVGRAVVDSR